MVFTVGRLRRHWQPMVDVALAASTALLFALSGTAVSVPLAVVQLAPLVWRRRFPAAVLIVVGAATAVHTTLGMARAIGFFPATIALYTAATHRSPVIRWVLCPAVGVAMAAASAVRHGPVEGLLMAVVTVTVAWLAGVERSEHLRQRDEANRQRAEAAQQRAEAEAQGAEAALQRAEAEAQGAEAAQQRAEAEAQRAEAAQLRAEAEAQGAEAAQQRAEAEAQRAEAARLRMERRMAEREVLAAEERERLARRVHDSLAHSVTVMLLQTEALRATSALDPGGERRVDVVLRAGREALAEVRAALAGGAERDSAALLATRLETLCAAGLRLAGPLPELRLPAPIDAIADRLIGEAATNALRHDGPGTLLTVTAERADDALLLRITSEPFTAERADDALVLRITGEPSASVGGDAARDGGGFGLRSLAEDLDGYGAQLAYGPLSPSGWLIEATFPLPVPATTAS